MSLRLTGADFDAFLEPQIVGEPRRGARARVELRQRVLSWARGVVARLAALGIAVLADEHPPASADPGRLRIAFLRDMEARAELERTLSASVAQQLTSAGALDHVCFALAIDAAAVAVSIELSPLARIDAKNLHARLADPVLADELTRALEALPEQFSISATPPTSSPSSGSAVGPLEALRAGASGLARALERAEDQLTPLWIGWSIPRAVAVTHSALLDEQLEDAIVALAGVYELIAWSPSNDRVKLFRDEGVPSGRLDSDDRAWDRRDRARARAKRRTQHKGSTSKPSPKRGGSRDATPPAAPPRGRGQDGAGSQRVRGGEGAPPAASQRGRSSRQDSPARGPREARDIVSSAGKAARAAARPILHATLRASLRTLARPGLDRTKTKPSGAEARVPGPGAGHPQGPGSPLARGARVRVLAGPFVDKIGVVQELDGRGGARVMLGLLATRLDVKDLVVSAEGRERPSLSSSHRRPIPGR